MRPHDFRPLPPGAGTRLPRGAVRSPRSGRRRGSRPRSGARAALRVGLAADRARSGARVRTGPRPPGTRRRRRPAPRPSGRTRTPPARLLRLPRGVRVRVGSSGTRRVSARRTSRCSDTRRVGASDSSTASRASSCRKAVPASTVTRIPDVRHSSAASTLSPHIASSSQGSTCGGAIETASTMAIARCAEARDPGEHGVTNGRRDLVAAAREDLADVERVPRRPPVQLAGVDPGAMRELGHCLR